MLVCCVSECLATLASSFQPCLHARHLDLGTAIGQAHGEHLARLDFPRSTQGAAFGIADDRVAAFERALRIEQLELRSQRSQRVAPLFDQRAGARVQVALFGQDLGAQGAQVGTVARPALLQLRQQHAGAALRHPHRMGEPGSHGTQFQALVRDLGRWAQQAAAVVVEALSAQLELLNPQRTLERGYAIVSNAQGQALRSPDEIKARQVLTVRLAEGSAEVKVSSVQARLE